jgi:hypothetical protein
VFAGTKTPQFVHRSPRSSRKRSSCARTPSSLSGASRSSLHPPCRRADPTGAKLKMRISRGRRRICIQFRYQRRLVSSLNSAQAIPSPDSHAAMNIPSFPFPGKSSSPEPSSSGSFHTVSQSWPPAGGIITHHEDTVSSSGSDVPEPVVYSASSRASSIFTPSTKSSSVDDLTDLLLGDYSGYESPMPADERIAEIRNERRYRMLLVHDFHPSREWLPPFPTVQY